jgi:putative transposon-encoded protein
MKIKITEKEKEIEGTLEKGKVTPFGTGGGHILSKGNHVGKNVNIIIPEEPIYSWVLGKDKLNLALKYARGQIEKNSDKDRTWKYKMFALDDIKSDKFSLANLNVLVTELKKSKAESMVKLAEQISEIYRL